MMRRDVFICAPPMRPISAIAPTRRICAIAPMRQTTPNPDEEPTVKIIDIKTYLMHCAPPEEGGWSARNWLFVKVETDEGIYGIGEASGWPRVVETAIRDLTPLILGEDPCHIEKLWSKMLSAMMGHGMTGVVGAGAMTGIEIALWDIKGQVAGLPIYELLGGAFRDRVDVYTHFGGATPETQAEMALQKKEEGYFALKGGASWTDRAALDWYRMAVRKGSRGLLDCLYGSDCRCLPDIALGGATVGDDIDAFLGQDQ